MGKLYDICDELDNLINIDYGRSVNPETGEILSIEEIDALNMEKDRLVKYFCQEMKNDSAAEKSLAEEIKRLQAKKKTIANHRDGLKYYISYCLKGEKWQADDKSFTVIFQKGKPSVVFADGFDFTELPIEYVDVEYVPRKADLLDALKNGKEIEGCSLKIGDPVMVVR